MNRPKTQHLSQAGSRTEAEHAEVASLAGKVYALPTRGPLAADANQPNQAPATVFSRAGLWLRRLAYWLVWLVTLALWLIAALRIFDHDASHLLIWINAFTRFVYLPAYACLALALWRRRPLLALANLAIVSCHLVWIAPDFVRDRRFDSAADDVAAVESAAQTVRIFFANVRVSNQEQDSLLREIQNANPDIVVLAEFTWLWPKAFRNSPIMAPYSHGMTVADSLGSVVVFSKLPLKSQTQDWIADRGVQTIEIPVGSQSLRLVGLHSPRPMDIRNYNYEGFWKGAVPLLLSMRGPLVVVGDFNATQYSLVYQQLKEGGLRSAHEDRGRGYATTWPNGQYWWSPPIRIDQAFLSREVQCLAISEGEGRGSDHRPLILDVRIRPKSDRKAASSQDQ